MRAKHVCTCMVANAEMFLVSSWNARETLSAYVLVACCVDGLLVPRLTLVISPVFAYDTAYGWDFNEFYKCDEGEVKSSISSHEALVPPPPPFVSFCSQAALHLTRLHQSTVALCRYAGTCSYTTFSQNTDDSAKRLP